MKDCRILYKTKSVCPVCLKKIPAERVLAGKEVFLRKSCDEHGSFSSIIWRGFYQIDKWIPESDNISVENALCPDKCGLCPDHLQKTCCVLLDITGRCNLNCSFCLANQCNGDKDPSFEEICSSLGEIIDKGKSLVQLSGGEPTTRDDLPDIIRYARDAGTKYVQLNSNGVRLGTEPDYVEKLAQAGLSFVFMQFDGTDDRIFRKLRNRPLLEIKKQAIENCAKFNMGVTLVPTMVRDVNMDNIGEIIRFAISQSPKVRGLHFQPMSYLGRIPELPDDRDRITLDELVYEIERQSDGLIKAADLLPSCCDHALCGFHGDFVVNRGQLVPLSRRSAAADTCCCSKNAAEKNREFVARRWLRPDPSLYNPEPESDDLKNMEYFLERVKTHGFTITSMAFQDAGTIDFSRLRKCSFHVYDKGELSPFCAHYLTAWPQ
jgi:uncharacterized radical SAM superfamily Fe-S cluster-containing enzyme